MKFYSGIILLLLVCFLSLGRAANYGKITGKVVDQQTGDPLIGANVVIEGQMIGAATDPSGTFIILQVPPGVYTLKTQYIGYAAAVQENVEVNANRITYANFKLTSSVFEGEEIVVTAERSLVQKDNVATLRSVNAEDIANLPAVTVDDILKTQPGIVSQGGNLHFRGGREGEITYYVDGVPLVNPLFSDISSQEVINQNAISEMQIISGTYSAEYGNAMSGIINITTKEGSRYFNSQIDVKSSSLGFNDASQDNNRNVIRASFSGPFFSSKTSFFLSGTYDNRDNYLPWGFRTQGNGYLKLTDTHIENFKISLGVNLSQGNRKSYTHRWKYIPDQYWIEPRTNSQLVNFGITHTLAANLFYNLNLYYNAYHYDSGDYNYQDLSSFYRLDANNEFYLQAFVSSYEKDDQKTFGLKGDILWQANNYNEFKAGFELRQLEIDRFYISGPYNPFPIIDDYLRKPREVAAYFQDKINFSSIILSAGVRFDLTDPNSSYWPNPYDAYYDRDQNFTKADINYQVSPRLGISYPVSEKTVFHFGYGHYFQRPEYQFIYKGMSDDNYKENVIISLSDGNGRYGNPDLKPERTIAYEFGLSHQISNSYLANITVYSKKVRNLTGSRTFFAGDKPEYWESFTLHINEDFASNNGFEIQLRKLRGKYLYGEINYTYAVAEGSSSRPLERVGNEEANRQTLKFFPLNFDQRHTVNANLSFRFPENSGPKLLNTHPLEKFRFSFLFLYGSGLPYSKYIRGATETYELNSKRLPENWTLDLKIDRRIFLGNLTLAPYLEVYNLTNRKNVVSVDPETGKPDFSYGRTYEYAADPENWGPPRIWYFGIEINY
jgi:outer membrane receptor protein involved in Fe transport